MIGLSIGRLTRFFNSCEEAARGVGRFIVVSPPAALSRPDPLYLGSYRVGVLPRRQPPGLLLRGTSHNWELHQSIKLPQRILSCVANTYKKPIREPTAGAGQKETSVPGSCTPRSEAVASSTDCGKPPTRAFSSSMSRSPGFKSFAEFRISFTRSTSTAKPRRLPPDRVYFSG
jgi:hypothetical protein